MARTFSEIIDLAETYLQDAGLDPDGSANQVFSAAELGAFLPGCLTEISRYRPYEVKETVTAAGSKNINISGIKIGLLRIEAVEYPAGQDPPQFRNWTQFGDIITLKIEAVPAAGSEVSIYCAKCHTLNGSVSTLDAELEELMARLIAARAARSKSRLTIGANSFGSADTPAQMLDWGLGLEADTISKLKQLVKPRKYVVYPTD
jgi:hypothetical protein